LVESTHEDRAERRSTGFATASTPLFPIPREPLGAERFERFLTGVGPDVVSNVLMKVRRLDVFDFCPGRHGLGIRFSTPYRINLPYENQIKGQVTYMRRSSRTVLPG
jgi:hypothetical protein